MIPTMPGRLYVVLNRFENGQPMMFRAATMPDAPTRKSSAAAIRDELAWRDLKGAADA